jgi:Protein of unknown function (DUF4239)
LSLEAAVGIVLSGIVVVVGAGLAACGIAMTIHGRIKQDTLTDFRDHSGLVSGVAGTLFAVTVGMLVVQSWGAIGTASNNAAAEARALDDLVWFAHTTRQPYNNHLTALLQTYTQQVIDGDWPAMTANQTLSQPAWQTLDAIRYEFNTYTPKGEAELARYQQALTQLQAVYDDRLVRQDEAKSSVPSILWLALFVSGSVVIIVPVVFGSTRRVVHGLLAFATTGVMAFVLFMIAEFTHPFVGTIRVEPEAFVTTEQHIQQIDALWAVARVQQAKAVFSPAPTPSSMISLLATPSPGTDRKGHKHRERRGAVPVPGLPAPGVPIPVIPTQAATTAAPPAPAPQPTGVTGSGPVGSPEPQSAPTR